MLWLPQGWDDAQRGIFLAFEGLGMTVANSLTGRAVKLLGQCPSSPLHRFWYVDRAVSVRLICDAVSAHCRSKAKFYDWVHFQGGSIYGNGSVEIGQDGRKP